MSRRKKGESLTVRGAELPSDEEVAMLRGAREMAEAESVKMVAEGSEAATHTKGHASADSIVGGSTV